MLGGLAAQQRAAGAPAALGDAFDDRGDALGHDLAHREVVEEEQRLGAGAHDVVGAHRDQVDAHGVEPSGGAGDLELGADAVGGRGEEPAVPDPEEPREPADPVEHLGAARLRREVADQRDGLGGRLDVDAGVAVGVAHEVGSRSWSSSTNLPACSGTGIGYSPSKHAAQNSVAGRPVASTMPSSER